MVCLLLRATMKFKSCQVVTTTTMLVSRTTLASWQLEKMYPLFFILIVIKLLMKICLKPSRKLMLGLLSLGPSMAPKLVKLQARKTEIEEERILLMK